MASAQADALQRVSQKFSVFMLIAITGNELQTLFASYISVWLVRLVMLNHLRLIIAGLYWRTLDLRASGRIWYCRSNHVVEWIMALVQLFMLVLPRHGTLIGCLISIPVGWIPSICYLFFEQFRNEFAPLPFGVVSEIFVDVKKECECCICLERVNAYDTILLMSCQHLMHDDCGRASLARDRRCPQCRKTF
eukprot:TRINITY_DN62750_c0_g1_i1.p1 TRINITY_DN62750_c0_g1~~TRINITY_DN62750_c0_g1_i1.p1  ORF type:complete len:215 (-),score=19.79 TRINITY_DN62750_c0_g1_i1:53-628(-)